MRCSTWNRGGWSAFDSRPKRRGGDPTVGGSAPKSALVEEHLRAATRASAPLNSRQPSPTQLSTAQHRTTRLRTQPLLHPARPLRARSQIVHPTDPIRAALHQRAPASLLDGTRPGRHPPATAKASGSLSAGSRVSHLAENLYGTRPQSAEGDRQSRKKGTLAAIMNDHFSGAPHGRQRRLRLQ